MGNPEVDSLKAAFSVASSRSEWSTVVVVVGVFIEFVALFVFSKHMPRSEKAVMVFATALVVLGCGGEYIFGSRATDAATQLQNASDIEVAEAHKSANEAAKKAGELGISLGTLTQTVDKQKKLIKDAVDDLNGKTAALNKARDDAIAASKKSEKLLSGMAVSLEKTQRLQQQIAESQRPRQLSPDQQIRIFNKLKSFSGTAFEFVTYPNEKEPNDLQEMLLIPLKRAGWIFNPNNEPNSLISYATAITIQVEMKDKKAQDAAIALRDSLNSEGISAIITQDENPMKKKIPIAMQIVIGAKP